MPLKFEDCGATPCTEHPSQNTTIKCCPDCLKYKANKILTRHCIVKHNNQYYDSRYKSVPWLLDNFENYEQIYCAKDNNSQPILVNDLDSESTAVDIILLDAQQAEQAISGLHPVKFAELQTSLLHKVLADNDFSVNLLTKQAQVLYQMADGQNSKAAWEAADIYAKLAEDTLKTVPVEQLPDEQKNDLLVMQSLRVNTLQNLDKKRASILKLKEFHRNFIAVKP